MTTCGDTPSFDAREDAPPALEIADLIDMQELYTNCLDSSNYLFGANNANVFHNPFMDQVEKINELLGAMGWGWADLARAMDLTEQRVNNWRKRGIPANQLRAVEDALGMKRFALEDDEVEEDGVRELSPKQRRLIERVPSLPDVIIDAIQAVIDVSAPPLQPPQRPASAVFAGQKKSKSPPKKAHDRRAKT